MGWKQVRNFSIGRMGKIKNMCLSNCEDGFGISKGERKEASAKTDYLNQKKNGTLHGIDSLPLNVAVPIYCDTPSQYEHVIVCDHGVCYDDGYRIDINKYKNIFGWGELCGGVRVVEYVKEPAKKSNEEIAKEVIEGKWGNGEDRKKRLMEAGYNYTSIQFIVNEMLKPKSSIKVGDKVKPKSLIDYNGKPVRSYHQSYTISQLNGDRAVLSVGGAIWCAMKITNLIKL